MYTNCKNIYDYVKKDGHAISDKGNALNVAVLRKLCYTEAKPIWKKARML